MWPSAEEIDPQVGRADGVGLADHQITLAVHPSHRAREAETEQQSEQRVRRGFDGTDAFVLQLRVDGGFATTPAKAGLETDDGADENHAGKMRAEVIGGVRDGLSASSAADGDNVA